DMSISGKGPDWAHALGSASESEAPGCGHGGQNDAVHARESSLKPAMRMALSRLLASTIRASRTVSGPSDLTRITNGCLNPAVVRVDKDLESWLALYGSSRIGGHGSASLMPTEMEESIEQYGSTPSSSHCDLDRGFIVRIGAHPEPQKKPRHLG